MVIQEVFHWLTEILEIIDKKKLKLKLLMKETLEGQSTRREALYF